MGTALTIHSPATAYDLAHCAGATTHQLWAMAKVQLRLGPSFALRGPDGTCIACGGYALGAPDGVVEGWFMASPAASRHMLAIVRLARLTGKGLAYRRIRVWVSTGAGRRIAKACGYQMLGTAMGLERWECEPCRNCSAAAETMKA